MPRGSTFSSTKPHFFKIILEETLREKRLLIPKKFVRLHEQTLSNSVAVKLPCGSEWKIEMKKHEGQVWLEKGWAKFAEHYSIVLGHMICFRYEGNSKFEAVIFDTSTVEIDYPFVPRHFEESDIDSMREVSEDASVENLEKSQSPCSRPRKRMRTTPIAKPQINSSCSKPEGSRHNETLLQNSRGSKSEMKGKRDLPSTSVGRKSAPTSRRISETIRRVKSLDRGEKSAALEKASGFTSDRPFFKVVMQPFYVHDHVLNFPVSFARTYLKHKSRNAILKVPNWERKTWPVKQSLVFSHRNLKASMSCGWKDFAQDNNLEVGDVCVFVLLKGINVSYEVVIFRANGNSRQPNSSAFNGAATRLDRCDKNSTHESESDVTTENRTRVPRSCNNSPAKQDNRSTSVCHKTSLESDAIGRQQALSPTEKARLLKRAHFESEKPFFKVVLQPSYISGHMPIKLDTVKRHIMKHGDIILRVPNSGSWSVRFKIWHPKTRRPLAEFGGGWKAFAEGNNLKVGDVCIFELVDGTEITSFDVSIVRIPEDDAYHQRSQALWDSEENDSESSDAINNETSTPNSYGKTSPKQEATTWQKALTTIEKNKALERAHFESPKPFFKVVMQPSYASSGYHMPVPNAFAQKYVKDDGDAILHVPNSTRSWPAKFQKRHLISGRRSAEISNGWKEFAKGNDLAVGDVCIFELTNATDIAFDVSIVRAARDDARRRCSQDGECSTCSKRVIIEVD